MKILTLRIYNSTPDYDNMYNIHKHYDKNSIYLTSSISVTEPNYNPETQILTVVGTESLIPGILEKTILGIEFCLKNLEFDVLIRSNMSTAIDYVELEKQISTIHNPYGGHIWEFSQRKVRFNFISGCCIVLNKDICNYLLDNKNDLIYQLPDDVAIGKLLGKKFQPTFSTRFAETTIISNNICFYRFRNDSSRYDHREFDIDNMKIFYKNLYRQ
jgi:hypothetical protein